MKILITFFVFLFFGASKLLAAPVDNPDSLKKQLLVTSDSLKAPLYTRLATVYLGYDKITDSVEKVSYQNNAILYTMQALHYYSRYNDTTGLRTSFDNLARVYYAQKKYSQAKWFILQSNTLSRVKKDIPNIISSLIRLAAIKVAIKDDTLALGDLNEALKLSVNNHFSNKESAVQASYAALYTDMKLYPKAAIALKRHRFIDDSIRRQEALTMIAQINSWDSIQTKKKLYTSSNKKLYKLNASKSIASL